MSGGSWHRKKRFLAEKFAEAAKSYEHNPVAFHLSAKNMLYEGLKENSTIVIVPSTAVESIQLGGACRDDCADHGIGTGTRQRTQGRRTQATTDG
jgi:hypothetical protein